MSDNEDSPPVATAIKKPVVMSHTFSSVRDGDWEDWLSSYETCAVINGWTDDIKCKFIEVSMPGRAIKIFRELDGAVRSDFARLKDALKLRFVGDSKPELFKSEILTRTRKPSETLVDLGNSIRTLTRKAYAELDLTFREELARDQFIRALNTPKLVLHLRHILPKDLDDAIR